MKQRNDEEEDKEERKMRKKKEEETVFAGDGEQVWVHHYLYKLDLLFSPPKVVECTLQEPKGHCML